MSSAAVNWEQGRYILDQNLPQVLPLAIFWDLTLTEYHHQDLPSFPGILGHFMKTGLFALEDLWKHLWPPDITSASETGGA